MLEDDSAAGAAVASESSKGLLGGDGGLAAAIVGSGSGKVAAVTCGSGEVGFAVSDMIEWMGGNERSMLFNVCYMATVSVFRLRHAAQFRDPPLHRLLAARQNDSTLSQKLNTSSTESDETRLASWSGGGMKHSGYSTTMNAGTGVMHAARRRCQKGS